MKILFLTDWFPPYSAGGAEQIVLNLANGFKERGYEVFVISTVQDKTKGNDGQDGIYRVYVPHYHERWRAYRSLYRPLVAKKIEGIIKDIKPDIVHAHNIHYYLSYHCLKIAKKYCPKVFLTAHDVQLFHYGKLIEFVDYKSLLVPKNFNYRVSAWQQIRRYKKRYNPFRNIIIRYYLGYVDKIFAVSRAVKEALNQNGIRNVAVVHNGINSEDWTIDLDEIKRFKQKYNLLAKKIVFFGGRLSFLKGGRQIIQAMAEVVKEVPDAVLLLVGRKDKYIEEISEVAQEKGVPLINTDWISGKELVAAYWSSEVVVVPSVYLDPFPTVNLEAMACKRPVIATCFGGSQELVVNGESGFVINPLDIKTTAKKIKLILEDETLATKFGNNGFQRIKDHFTINHQIDRLLKFYLSSYD